MTSILGRLTPWLLVYLLLTACATPHKVTEWHSFEMVEGKITIPVSVRGKETSAIFDTGSNSSVIDYDFARSIGIRRAGGEQVISLADRKRVTVSESVSIEFFGTSIGESSFLMDLANRPQKVILSSAVIRGSVVEIDFPRKLIRFHNRGGFKYKGPTEPLRIYEHDHLYYLDLIVKGKKQSFLLDTGASGTLIIPASTAEIQNRVKEGATPDDISGIHNEVRTSVTEQIPEFRLGSYTFRDVPIRYFDSQGAESNALFGLKLLEDFTVIIDTYHNNLYIELRE